MFLWKNPKKMLDLLKDTQNFPSGWFSVVPSLEKLTQVVVASNDQANLQPTLNKEAGGATITILWLIVGLKKSLGVKFKDGICAELCLNLWFKSDWIFCKITESRWFGKRLSKNKVANNHILKSVQKSNFP